MTRAGLGLALLGCALAACDQRGSGAGGGAQAAGSAAAALTTNLKPLPGHEGDAPKLTRKTTVRMQTTAGDVVIDLFPEAAPNAVKRFVELVRSGFYDDTPISRVVPGFVAQFGVNWREPHKAWKEKKFADDPTYFALALGSLAGNAGALEVWLASTQSCNSCDVYERAAQARGYGRALRYADAGLTIPILTIDKGALASDVLAQLPADVGPKSKYWDKT